MSKVFLLNGNKGVWLRKTATGLALLALLIFSTCQLDDTVLDFVLITGIQAPTECNTRQELSLAALVENGDTNTEYFWICDRGTLQQQSGREVSWLAPENPGKATITLIACNNLTRYSTHKSVKIDVQDGEFLINGTVSALELRTTLYKVEPTEAMTLSSVNSWAQFPGLILSDLTLHATTNVFVTYQISGSGGNAHLITRLMIDGVEQYGTRSITGDTTYICNNALWIGSLSAGTHTIAVEYRTPYAATYYAASGSNWQTRSLTVLVMGS